MWPQSCYGTWVSCKEMVEQEKLASAGKEWEQTTRLVLLQPWDKHGAAPVLCQILLDSPRVWGGCSTSGLVWGTGCRLACLAHWDWGPLLSAPAQCSCAGIMSEPWPGGLFLDTDPYAPSESGTLFKRNPNLVTLLLLKPNISWKSRQNGGKKKQQTLNNLALGCFSIRFKAWCQYRAG